MLIIVILTISSILSFSIPMPAHTFNIYAFAPFDMLGAIVCAVVIAILVCVAVVAVAEGDFREAGQAIVVCPDQKLIIAVHARIKGLSVHLALGIVAMAAVVSVGLGVNEIVQLVIIQVAGDGLVPLDKVAFAVGEKIEEPCNDERSKPIYDKIQHMSAYKNDRLTLAPYTDTWKIESNITIHVNTPDKISMPRTVTCTQHV